MQVCTACMSAPDRPDPSRGAAREGPCLVRASPRGEKSTGLATGATCASSRRALVDDVPSVSHRDVIRAKAYYYY